jgi:hypothetical protein
MSKGLVVGTVIVFAVLLGLPLLGQFAKQSNAPADSGQAASQAPAAGAPGAPPAPPQAPGAPMMGQQPPPPPQDMQQQQPQAPLLNTQNLTNTEWSVQGYNIALLPNGVASINGGMVQGKWSVQGDILTATAMGQTVRCNIVGDQIVGPDGNTVQRTR